MENIKLPPREAFPPHLSVVSTPRAVATILGDWAIIAASIGLALRFPGVFTFVAAQLIVASRQHALFAAMHEGTHYLISKNRLLNDHLSNFLAAWAVGFSTERYRLRHWIHHRYLNTEKDPDWMRKKDDPTWQLPMPAARFWACTLPHLLGKGVKEMAYAFLGIGITRRDLPLAIPYYAAIAAAITYFGGWKAFCLYWALPYFTVLPLLHRVRNASEHLAVPKTHILNGTRNVVGSSVESFFFSPHKGNLHLIHHIYPFIPCSRLEDAHVFLLSHDSYREHAYENDSYFLPTPKSVYKDMTGTFPAARASAERKAA